MTPEHDFLHEISNHVATAKMSVEITLELLEGSPPPDAEKTELIKTALAALNTLASIVAARRQDLIAAGQ